MPAGAGIHGGQESESSWEIEPRAGPHHGDVAFLRPVPNERIEVLPRRVASTHDEALLLKEYVDEHHLRSLLVVTSAYHSRRALWTFRRAFEGSGVAVGVAEGEPGLQTPTPGTWWFSPRGWRAVAGEYVKMVYYRLSY